MPGDTTTDPERRARRAESFGPVADTYDRARPDYPSVAITDALGPKRLRVLDVGAGTGKLTRVVLAAGHEVVAVDPSDQMLDVLGRLSPEVERHVGKAEFLPVPDHSVDAVVAGQAAHWFDLPVAGTEFARVLRPGGVVALLWNVRDDSEEWIRRYDLLVDMVRSHDRTVPPDLGPRFVPATLRRYSHEQRLTVDDLVGLASSRSYVITSTGEERERILAEVRELGESTAQDDGLVRLRYDLEVWTAGLAPTE